MLYARDRWAPVFDRRHRDPATGPTQAWHRRTSLLGAGLAAAVAAFSIAWASGMALGRDSVTARGQNPAEALTQLVFAMFTLAAAIGLPLLVYRRPRQARVLGLLVLKWVGGASMVTCGSWSLISATTNPQLAASAFVAMTAWKWSPGCASPR